MAHQLFDLWGGRASESFAEELLGSRRVQPARATALGYAFRHPELDGALADLTG